MLNNISLTRLITITIHLLHIYFPTLATFEASTTSLPKKTQYIFSSII